jgi:hypothetical protein
VAYSSRGAELRKPASEAVLRLARAPWKGLVLRGKTSSSTRAPAPPFSWLCLSPARSITLEFTHLHSCRKSLIFKVSRRLSSDPTWLTRLAVVARRERTCSAVIAEKSGWRHDDSPRWHVQGRHVARPPATGRLVSRGVSIVDIRALSGQDSTAPNYLAAGP